MTSYPRWLEGILKADASQDKVRLLFGARQTGKSTLLQRVADTDTRVFNLQERRTRLEMERDPHVLTQILEACNKDRKLFVCMKFFGKWVGKWGRAKPDA